MVYQWDAKKAESNRKNHGVDFADAIGVFKDDYALSLREEFVDGEQRFASIGLDFLARVIVVVYTYRGDDIRVISARLATKESGRLMKVKEHDFTNAKRGAIVKSPKGKTLVSIRIDNDILDWFRGQVHNAGGGDYETLVNKALRDFLRHQDRGFEKTLRKIIREELDSMAKRAA